MNFTRTEVRTIHHLAVTDATPVERRSESSNTRPFMPRQIEVPVISTPGKPDRIGPVDVHGPLVNRNGTLARNWVHERYWPQDWTKAPPIVQQALRELDLTELAGLPT